MNSIFDRLNFRRYPLRGVLAEIAREDDVTRQAVRKRVLRGDPDTIARIAVKVRKRRRKEAALERALR